MIVRAVAGDKVQFWAGGAGDLTGRIKAGELVNAAAAVAGGKGGGKPDMAMAGAADVAKLADAMKAARTFIGEKLA